MITISFEHTTDYDLTSLFQEASKERRLAYNRIEDGLSEKEIRAYLKSMSPNSMLSAYMQDSVIKSMVALKKSIDALNDENKKKNIANEKKYLKSREDGKPIKQPKKLNENIKPIFGSKKNWDLTCKKKRTREEWKKDRLKNGLTIQGEALCKGNRHFELHIDEDYVLFKLNRKEHIKLNIKSLGKKWKKELLKLQALNNVKVGEQGYTYTVRITFDKVCISFEEFKQPPRKLNKNNYAGIDLNPSNIGFSICNNKEVKFATEYNFKKIIDEICNSKLASDDAKNKHLQNKLDHETYEIPKTIVRQCLHHSVKFLFVEDLQFKTTSNDKGKRYNRRTKNLWKRNKFLNNLEKRCNEVDIKLIKIDTEHTTFIGNLMYSYVDSVNASLEIARRGFEVIIKKVKNSFYPPLTADGLKHQWKEFLGENINSWVDLNKQIKNSKLRYRVPLKDTLYEGFKMSSKKSRVERLVFT
ncbi:MAG: hypothetical protein FWC41_05745 [Firmicutes bacterium]|nr:hypothetical protein [Bacillota bacterium]